MFNAKRLFQVAVNGIIEQNKKCKTGEYGVCCYRNRQGERCVVGMAIPPEKYVVSMDDESSTKDVDDELMESVFGEQFPNPGIYAHRNPFVLKALMDEYGSPITQEDLELLEDLQTTHDEKDPEEWRELFRKTEEFFFGEESDLCGLKEKTNV